MELAIIIDFNETEDGSLTGLIDIPLQQAIDLPLINIQLKANSISFEIQDVPGSPKFDGNISEDGNTISGDFTQSGQNFTFEIKRKSLEEAILEEQTLEECLNKIRTFIDSTMKIWKVPGVAIAVVKGGEVILSEGFGLRNVQDSLPVTVETIFAIGSSTKAFTALSVGLLVDEGIVDWNEPVKTYLPTFKLYDEYATTHMTPKDLLTHRSGLPRHDLMWYGSPFTREEIFNRLQYLEPNKDFRYAWQYQNLMFMTAGYIVGKMKDCSWEEFVNESIFTPLGMTNSNFSVLESQETDDYALPYKKKDEEIKEMSFRDISNIGPAGSINSNVTDMAKWIQLHLNDGKVGETQIISEAVLQEILSPQIIVTRASEYPELSYTSYCLGWMIQTYRGHKLIQHGGNIDGFSALVSLLPDDNFGIVILTNLNASAYPTVLNLYATDLLLDLEPVDWHSRYRLRIEMAKEAKKEDSEDIDRKKKTKPSHKLAEYVGEYENPGYGLISVELNGKKLKCKYHSLSSDLEHWHYDVFKATDEFLDEAGIKIQFLPNLKGDIDKLTVPFEPSLDPIVFTKKPSLDMYNPEFLSQFIGEYELAGQIIKIDLKGEDSLILTVPGQPVYELVPYKDTEFTLKDYQGFSVIFTVDKKKGVTEVIFNQPNGVFTAKRVK